jgi:RHS repeat-associated protein
VRKTARFFRRRVVFYNYGRAEETSHFPGTQGAYTTTASYTCCGVESTTDRHGVTTTYAYDGLGRQIKSTTLGVTTETVHNGLTTDTHRYTGTGPAATGNRISSQTRNRAGATTSSSSPNSFSTTAGDLVATTTATTYANGLTTTLTTVPGGAQQTTITYPDGRIWQTYGDLQPTMTHGYTVNGTGLVTTSAYAGGNETTVTTTDWAGRTRNITKGTESTDYTYNSLGQLESVEDADGVRTLYAYNSLGERTTTALDVNDNGTIDPGGTDQITVTTSVPGTYGGYSVMTTTTGVYATNSSSTVTTAFTAHQTPDGLHSWTIGAGTTAATSRSATIGSNGSWTETTAKPDGTYVVSSYAGGLLDQTISYDSEDNEIASTTIGYDGLNRPETSTDSRTGTTTTLYVSATCDAVASVTDPGSRVTSFTYDSRGNRTTVTHPNTTSVTSTSYYPSGQVRATWGSLAYPTFTTYDYAGRQKTLRTQPTIVSGIPTDAGGSLTTWNYSAVNGRLTSKLDNSDKGTSYTYTDAGRPYTRAWARGTLSTTYGYTAGQLTTTNYSDSTPDVTVTYSRFGRPLTITQFQQSKIEYTYTADLAIDTEIVSIDLNHDGDFADSTDLVRTLDRSDDTLKRTTGWQLKDGGTTENQATYTYDSAGRLDTVEDATNTFTYGYQYNQTTANDPRAGSTSGSKQDFMPYTLTKSSGSPTLQTLRTYEATRDALSVIQNKAGTTTRSSYTYTVNGIGQRTDLTTAFNLGSGVTSNPGDTDWGYDSLGQVQSAAAPGTDADRYFAYDNIGNRLQSRTGTATDSDGTLTEYFGALTPSTVAGANALNQYVRIARGGTSFVPGYDDDGNATSYPLPAYPTTNSTLVWDAENRLISAAVNSITTTYLYDALSRRIAKIPDTGSATLYIHDGFNCIAEYTGTTLSKIRTWGLDLSGTLQGAGGVGGLLAEKQGGSYFYPTYDGNGNVSEYLAADGTTSAHFEYDPFGNTTVDTDSATTPLFAYRFSTKPLDFETGLYYYGYRYYDPLTGRWKSRDPIEEQGGVNLYVFVANDGVNRFDVFGLKTRNWVSYILAGHGDDTAISKLEQTMQAYEKWATYDKDHDRVSAVSCFNGDINSRFPRSIRSQLDQFDDINIWPNFYASSSDDDLIPNPKEPGFLWINSPRVVFPGTKGAVKRAGLSWLFNGPDEAYPLMEQKIKGAEKQAETDANDYAKGGKDNVCTIKVKVTCLTYIDVSATTIDFFKVPIPSGKQNPCTYENTYSSKRKSWKTTKFNP